MRSRLMILSLLLLPYLSGCFGAAAIGVGAGALVLADRRHSETVVTDEGIELRVSSRISEQFADRVHINITSYNRVVLLTGEVPDQATMQQVMDTVAGVANVKAISNELQIAGNSSYSSRGNDSYITSKVKARFIDDKSFAANHVKVVTENSVVYLMGLVTQAEAEAAVAVARTTGGVRKVVRAFEIITEEQAEALSHRRQNQSEPAAR